MLAEFIERASGELSSRHETWPDCRQWAVSVFAAGCGPGAGVSRVTVAAIREETDPEINDRAAADEKLRCTGFRWESFRG